MLVSYVFRHRGAILGMSYKSKDYKSKKLI